MNHELCAAYFFNDDPWADFEYDDWAVVVFEIGSNCRVMPSANPSQVRMGLMGWSVSYE